MLNRCPDKYYLDFKELVSLKFSLATLHLHKFSQRKKRLLSMVTKNGELLKKRCPQGCTGKQQHRMLSDKEMANVDGKK